MLAVNKTIYWLSLMCKNLFDPVFLSCTHIVKMFVACRFHWDRRASPSCQLYSYNLIGHPRRHTNISATSLASTPFWGGCWRTSGLSCVAFQGRAVFLAPKQSMPSTDDVRFRFNSFFPSCPEVVMRQSCKERFFSPSGPLNSVLM